MQEAPYPIRPPQLAAFPSHVQWSGDNALLSPAECESVIRHGETLTQGFATIGNGTNNDAVLDLEYRCVKSCDLWRLKDGDLTWLYERVRQKVEYANRDYYRFDLTGLGEAIQFLKYETLPDKPPGHYRWHQDFGGGISSNRKLSMVVNLSDPRDYDGCRLQLYNERQWEPTYIQQGEAILFPSWTPHQVTPITRGTRYALAIWIHGPQFR